MNIVEIFPTKVAIIDDVICDENIINDLLYNHHDILEIVSSTQVNVIQNRYVLHNQFYANLSSQLLKHATFYAKEHLRLKYDEYQFSQSWVTNCEPGKQRHYKHIHPNSLISGVYYFQNNDKLSSIVMNREENIYDKNMFGDFREEELYSIPYVKNRLILFPSSQSHFVPSNNSDIVRKSLVFNILPIGAFGDPYGELSFSKLK